MTSVNASSKGTRQSPDEGVLRDVLEQLDRERAKRAEVEAKIKILSDKLAREKEKTALLTRPESLEREVSRAAFVSMEAQVKGYKQIVDALTEGIPAIDAASKYSNQSPQRKHPKTLPLHVVRLLEVIPWDTRTQEQIFGHEDVFEWQIFDARENRWQSNLRYFPPRFKTLPVFKSHLSESLGSSKDRSLLLFLAAGEKHSSKSSKYGVLTDERISQTYKLEEGYPLPNDGGVWEWIGGWRVDTKITPSVNCDSNGWSYVSQPEHFLEKDLSNVLNSPVDVKDGSTFQFRRRKWTRRRVLVDYPLASERTRHYLKLLAENARLSVTAAKLSEQVSQTKTALTQTEIELTEARALIEKQKMALDVVGCKDSN